LNYLRKIFAIFIICLFSTIYIGCNKDQCWVCEGDGKNICVICEDKDNNNLNCIFCDNTKESICTFCNGKGFLLNK